MPEDEATEAAWGRMTRDALLRHVVALGMTYRDVGDSAATGERKFGGATAFLFEFQGACMLVTARHVVTEFINRITSCVLVHYMWPGAIDKHPIEVPDLFQRAVFPDEKAYPDLDIAVLPLVEKLKAKVLANGVLPLSFNAKRQGYAGFDGFATIGIPDEWTQSFKVDGSSMTMNRIRSNLIPLMHVETQTEEGKTGIFSAEILDKENLVPLHGMSGSPVFGFIKKDSQYELVAVLTHWIDTHVWAVPIADVHKWLVDITRQVTNRVNHS